MGFIQLVMHPPMRNVCFCFSSVLYYSPFFLLLSKLIGHRFGRADKPSMLKLMRDGSDFVVVILHGVIDETAAREAARRHAQNREQSAELLARQADACACVNTHGRSFKVSVVV